MKNAGKCARAAAFLALAGLCAPGQAVAASLIVEILPGNALFSSGLNGFTVSRNGVSDKISTPVGYAPAEKIGISWKTPAGVLDLTAGGAFLINQGFWASMYAGDVAFHFPLGKRVALGPHVGAVGVLPRWTGLGHSSSADVSIADGAGVMPGVTLTAGRKIFFTASADYLIMNRLAVTTANGWTADRNSVGLGGFMLQVGVGVRLFGGSQD